MKNQSTNPKAVLLISHACAWLRGVTQSYPRLLRVEGTPFIWSHYSDECCWREYSLQQTLGQYTSVHYSGQYFFEDGIVVGSEGNDGLPDYYKEYMVSLPETNKIDWAKLLAEEENRCKWLSIWMDKQEARLKRDRTTSN